MSSKVRCYKVRAAITYAHYLLVTASSPSEAERLAMEHCNASRNAIVTEPYDWEGEATHINTTYEVEEA